MPKKILVVDDEAQLVDMVKIRLEANNYLVLTAYDGQEAIEKARKDKPDLILLDIVMPDMNGYQICSHLKQNKNTVNIPILLLTGKELEPKGISERCINLGVEGSLLKPVDSKELLDKIREVLKGR